MEKSKQINELRSKIAELTGVLRHFNRQGYYLTIDAVAFRYLADLLRKQKEELALLESEELIQTCMMIKSN